MKALPWDKATRYTISICVPLMIGFAVGQLRYGVTALIGSMYLVNIANADASLRDRLLATLAGSVAITKCAELGVLSAHSPGLLDLGVLILGVAAGWMHTSHIVLEILGRFAVIGFLFGAVQLAAFGTKLIDIDERVVLAFLLGGIWTTLVIAIESLLRQNSQGTDSQSGNQSSLIEGWRRIRSGRTAGLRFALCYGIVAAIGFAGSTLLGLPRPFWVAVTTLVVMKPDSRATIQRTAQRVFGTLVGVILVGGIIQLTQDPKILIGCIALVAPLVPIGLATNYTLCCTAVTILVMLLLDLLTLSQGGDLVLLPVRFYATVIGCMLAAIGMSIAYPERWWRNKPES